MTYSPYTRSATRSSGIVFFGEAGNADVLTSDTNFLLEDGAAGNIQAPNFKVADGGRVGSVSAPTAITIASNGNVTTSNNLSVTGDLTVNGTTTTVNSTVTTIEDPVIIIGSGAGDGYGGATDDNKDRGIAFAWNNNDAGNGQLGFFGHDDSEQRFVYYTSGTMTNDVFTGTRLGDAEFRWGLFHAVSGNLVGNVTGDVTGTASDATILETTRTFSITGEGTATAQNFNGSQNVALPFVLDVTAVTNQSAVTNTWEDQFILVASGTTLEKISRTNFLSGLGAGSFDTFTVTADAGVDQSIVNDDTLDIAGGSGIQTVVGATDTVTINMKIDQSTLGYTTDILEVQDGGITATQLNTSVAGDGLTGGGGSALAVNTGAGLEIDTDAVRIAASAAGNGLTGGGGSALSVVAGTGITVNAQGVNVTLADYTLQTVAPESVSTTASRSYSVQVNSSDQLVVNVPWTDVNELTTEEVQDIVGDQLVTNGSHTLISAAYDDAGDGAIDLTVDNDLANYDNTNSAFITASSTDTLTNKTFDANGTGNSISNIEVADLAGSAVVTEGEGIASNDNDTTLPTSAAVKDYVDSASASALKTVVTDTGSETLLDGEDVCLADATAGNITITLPGIDSGRQVTVKKTDSSANTVTVTGATGNIDGAANVILYSQNESVTLICDATNWFVI